jgi:hypothetical protein
LLKFVIEEMLGFPTVLVSDGLLDSSIGSALNLAGPESVYLALAAGEADIYPEVKVVSTAHRDENVACGSGRLGGTEACAMEARRGV